MYCCGNCGAQLNADMRFCKKCGTKVEPALRNDSTGIASVASAQPPIVPAHQEIPSILESSANLSDHEIPATQLAASLAPSDPSLSHAASPRQLLRMKRIPKLAVIGASALVLLLLGGYKFGQYWMSEDRLLNKFEHALEQKNGGAIASLLKSEDGRLSLNEQTLPGFMAYLDKHPDAVNSIMGNLHAQTFLEGSGEEPSEEAFIHLARTKKFGLLHSYKLMVKPVFFTLSSNYKDVTMFINGQEVFTTTGEHDEHQFGPYLPGIYELEAKLKTGFVDLSAKQEAVLWEGDHDYSTSLDLQGEQVTIQTGVEQSGLKGRLFINGKDVGINPFETTTFGPLTTDGSLKMAVEADYPWGTSRTNEIAIDGTSVNVKLADSAAIQSALMDVVVRYEGEWLDGLTSRDVQKLNTGTEAARAALQSSIDNATQNEMLQISKYTGAKFDLDSFRLYESNGQWQASLVLIAQFMNASYATGEFPPQELYEDGQGQDVVLVYDEKAKSWKIDSVNTFYDGYEMSEHVKEVEEKSPKTYQTADNGRTTGATGDLNATDAGSFLIQYANTAVGAINARDFTLVSGMIDESGPAYKESADYIVYLKEKGITEQLQSITVDEVTLKEDGSYVVADSESYAITYNDGTTKIKNFKSSYKIVLINGAPRVNQLLSTQEQ